MYHDSFTYVPWLIHICAMTHAHMCHDSFTYVPWLIHIARLDTFHVPHSVKCMRESRRVVSICRERGEGEEREERESRRVVSICREEKRGILHVCVCVCVCVCVHMGNSSCACRCWVTLVAVMTQSRSSMSWKAIEMWWKMSSKEVAHQCLINKSLINVWSFT